MRVEWKDQDKRGVIMWKVPEKVDLDDEVIVREDEFAVFFDDGKAVSVIEQAGSHRLQSDSPSFLDPIIALLGGGRKAEVFYIQGALLDGKFGSREPFPFKDREFGLVRLSLFGKFRYRVRDCRVFMKEFVGTLNYNTSHEIERRVRDQIVVLVYDVLGDMMSRGLGVVDIAANLSQIEALVVQRSETHLYKYGLKLDEITSINISMPEEVQQAVDARASMTVVGTDYTTYQAGKAAADDKRPVILAENVRVGDDITIKDSVVQRSKIGHEGTGGPIIVGGKRTDDSKITVEDSVIIRSKLGPGDEIRDDVSQNEGPSKCPSCGEALDPSRPPTFCPNCGKQLVK